MNKRQGLISGRVSGRYSPRISTGDRFMIKVGIIGFGYMGHYHWNKVKQTGKAEVTAICDIDPDRLEEGRKNGFHVYTPRELNSFLKEETDLVVIATPNQFHTYYSIKSMEAGHHVLCEKPVTLNVNDLNKIISEAEKTGKIFTAHLQRRFDRDYLMVKKTIESGVIGNVHTIESRIMGERGVCYGWRADPAAGGGMLYDWGPHLIDQYLQMFSGEKVLSVQARLKSILTPAVDDYVELNLSFSNNIYAKIIISTFALQKMPRWYVLADRGTMKLDDMTGESGGIARIKREVKGFDSVLGKSGLGPSRTMAPLEPGYMEKIALPEVEDTSMNYWNGLIDCIANDRTPYVKPEDILRQMKIIELAQESSRSGQVIQTEL
jgi:scyllo-inositol 2-dehydrogenase (NADP+)